MISIGFSGGARMRHLSVSLIFLVCAQQAYGSQHNLLENGSFSASNQTVGWINGPSNSGSFSWSADDANGSPESGSIDIDTPASRSSVVISSCFALKENAPYTVNGKIRLVSGGLQKDVRFECDAFPSNDCSGASTSVGIVNGASATNSWDSNPVPVEGTLPANVASAQCTLRVLATEDDIRYHFDDLEFISDASTPVTLQSFFVE